MRYSLLQTTGGPILIFTPEGVLDGEKLDKLERHLRGLKPPPVMDSNRDIGVSGELFLELATKVGAP